MLDSVSANIKLMQTIKSISKVSIAYALLPFKRNQDLVSIQEDGIEGLRFVASIVDGWNNPKEILNDIPGKEVAKYVSRRLPEVFLTQHPNDLKERAEKSAEIVDKEVLAKWPAHASCVGAFLFSFMNEDVLLTLGSVTVFVYRNRRWEKPSEVGDYSLNPAQYPSDVSRFIGRGELKNDPLYSAKPDIFTLQHSTPILITTDGFDDLFSESEFNKLTSEWKLDSAEEFILDLEKEIKKRKNEQKDDIAIFLRLSTL